MKTEEERDQMIWWVEWILSNILLPSLFTGLTVIVSIVAYRIVSLLISGKLWAVILP